MEAGTGFPTVSDPLEEHIYSEYLKSGWNLNKIHSLSGSLLSFESSEASRNFAPRIHVGMCFSPIDWVMPSPVLHYTCLCIRPFFTKHIFNFPFFFWGGGGWTSKQKVEEHQLYSLSYMHLGEPKVWYSVPGRYAVNFETIRKKYLSGLYEEQPDVDDNLVSSDLTACYEELFFLEK